MHLEKEVRTERFLFLKDSLLGGEGLTASLTVQHEKGQAAVETSVQDPMTGTPVSSDQLVHLSRSVPALPRPRASPEVLTW